MWSTFPNKILSITITWGVWESFCNCINSLYNSKEIDEDERREEKENDVAEVKEESDNKADIKFGDNFKFEKVSEKSGNIVIEFNENEESRGSLLLLEEEFEENWEKSLGAWGDEIW